VALLLLLGTAGLAVGKPQITIDPTAGYCGQGFEFTCTWFLPGDEATQTYYWADCSLFFSRKLVADVNGDVACGGWTAGPDEPTGLYTVVLSGLESDEATATFEVLGEEFVLEPALTACSHDWHRPSDEAGSARRAGFFPDRLML